MRNEEQEELPNNCVFQKLEIRDKKREHYQMDPYFPPLSDSLKTTIVQDSWSLVKILKLFKVEFQVIACAKQYIIESSNHVTKKVPSSARIVLST